MRNVFEITESEKRLYLEYKKVKEELEMLKKQFEFYHEKKRRRETLEKWLEDHNFQIKAIELKCEVTYDEIGIPIIDDTSSSDFENKYVDSEFDRENFSLDDIFMVHATNYFPKNHTIKTSKDSGVMYEKYYALIPVDGEDKKGYAYSHRNSIHFALNGLVSHVTGGNQWDQMGIIIIEPIKEQIESIRCIRPEDTWTNTSVKLSERAIILLSEDKYEKFKQDFLNSNTKYNIIKFKGTNTEKIVQKILIILGVKPQRIGMWNWVRNKIGGSDNSAILKEYVTKNYPDKLQESHSATFEHKLEEQLDLRDKILSAIRDEKLFTHNGMYVSYREVFIMLEYILERGYYYGRTRDDILKMMLIKNFGLRVKNNQFYLLDDDSILESYYKGINSEVFEAVEKTINLYELIVPNLIRRKQSLKELLKEDFDTKKTIILGIDVIENIYYDNIKYFDDILDFLNKYGIRKLDDRTYCMLSDFETINQYGLIDDNFVQEMENLIRSNQSKCRITISYDD